MQYAGDIKIKPAVEEMAELFCSVGEMAMPEAMQKIHNKDKSGIRFCPRCHAQNLTGQTVCGKCGLVFSQTTEKKGEKTGSPFASGGAQGEQAETSSAVYGHNHSGASRPPPLPGEQGIGGSGQSGGGEEGTGGNEEAPSEPPKPKRPDALPEKGATEGPIRETGGSPICPHCGAELREGLKRCPRCGFKIGKR